MSSITWSSADNDIPKVSNVPFEQGDNTSWRIRMGQVSDGISSFDFSAIPYTSIFTSTLFPLLVYDINRMEGTLVGYNDSERQGSTIKKIRSYFEENCEPAMSVAWGSEGGRELSDPSSDTQLYQSAAAVKYLLIDNVNSQLSLDLIITTHRIMMENSFSLDGHDIIPTLVGNVRTTEEVNAGMYYQFVESSSVLSSMKYLVSEYNSYCRNRHAIDLATYLFYEMITIHPFTNGNGRLCRLFLAWSLMNNGFPFPVSFSSGHSKHR